MIVLAVAMTMAASAAPVAPAQERKALGMCLSKFVHDKLEAKMDAAAFKAAAKTACAAQDTAFRTAWTNYYVGMNTKRSEAQEIAGSQADDYFQNSTDTYVSSTAPAADHPAHAATAAAGTPHAGATPAGHVTPASSTTPPRP